MVTLASFDTLARDFVSAFDTHDQAALDRLNAHYQRRYTFDDLSAEIWRRVYAHRQRSSRGDKSQLLLEEARTLVAQDAGYPSWSALDAGLHLGTPPVDAYAIDLGEHRASPRRQLTSKEWDALIAEMAAHGVTRLDASGLMTDAVLARVATLPHITSLSLEGSRQLSDVGIALLARMPQLQELNLTGTKVNDANLSVLRELPNLRSFDLTWHCGVSDEGVSHLRHCHHLQRVNLMGSTTGDGAIAALQGKPWLNAFDSGRMVTDTGVRLLHNLPLFRRGDSAQLLIDGPVTDDGLASLAGLDGVAALDLFWHCSAITPAGVAHLVALPNLKSLGADGALTNDISLTHIARLPQLRKLRAQEATATDAGFEALSRSPSLEGFWGRECAGFGNRAFLAFSKMPTLRELGVSCASVDETTLAAFPQFPALRSLTPIGVTDRGFAHIGRCAQIDRLTCMYCRTTTDDATRQITNLPLRYYYAGLTLITDESLMLLGQMATLEQVEFYETRGITDAGLPFLAGLPHLREIAIDSAPGVTPAGTRVFPSHVRVRYST